MKAAQIVAPRTYRLIDTPTPSIDNGHPNRVLVRMNRACICGSDAPYFLNDLGDYPAAPGLSIHECIGTIVDSTSPRFRPGDRVLAVPDGQHGFAEYFTADAERTLPLPGSRFSNEILMAQPLGTVVWAFRKLPNLLNKNAVVLGQGPMGLLIDALLSNLGAKRIIGIDRVPERLAVAHQMGATHRIDVAHEDPRTRVAEITDGRMADVVIEAVGHQTETLNECLDLVRNGGTILAFGVADDLVYPFRFKEFYFRNLHLIGSVQPEPQADFGLALDMIAQGRIDVAPIITHEVGFTEPEIQRAFELFTERKDGAIKVIIHFE